MSISGTEQAAQGKRTLSPFLATKAVFYAAIVITIRRADHFQVKVHVLPFSLTSSFWVSGHFESDLSHSALAHSLKVSTVMRCQRTKDRTLSKPRLCSVLGEDGQTGTNPQKRSGSSSYHTTHRSEHAIGYRGGSIGDSLARKNIWKEHLTHQTPQFSRLLPEWAEL